MSQKSLKTELVMEKVVTCPKCHQRNRLSKLATKGVYRCGICGVQLPNPFVYLSEPQAKTSPSSRFSVKKVLIISVLTAFGLFNLALVRSCLSDLSNGYSSSASSTPTASPSEILAKQAIVVPSSLLSTPVASPSKTVTKQNRTLPSSTVITSPAQSGRGSLEVSNGTSRDAYIKLVAPSSSQLVAAFYVKSNSTFTLQGIPDGVYQVLFVLGEDWDSKTRTFTTNASFSRFDRSLNFVTTRQTNSTRYTIFKLTLHSVVGGDATTSPINEQEFTDY
jgi:ribosomal protein L37AE/L43A